MPSVWDIRKTAIEQLEQSGIQTARLDVDLLLEDATGITPLDIILEPKQEIDMSAEEIFQKLILRRLAREPVSQILGKKDFWSLTFKVSRDCLTPRPDSETLIEAALKTIIDKNKSLKILDLGTGSGCLLLSLMSELPNSQGTGLDLSEKALDIAKINARDLGFSNRCRFILSDWADQLPPNERFDIILCNPPYIAAAEKADLDADVREYEPHMALFAEDRGYGEYRKLARIIPDLMQTGGRAFLEIGHKQGAEVKAIFRKTTAQNIRIIADLAGRDRCVALNF